MYAEPDFTASIDLECITDRCIYYNKAGKQVTVKREKYVSGFDKLLSTLGREFPRVEEAIEGGKRIVRAWRKVPEMVAEIVADVPAPRPLVPAAMVSPKVQERPATRRQLWALWRLYRRDYRGTGLGLKEASQMITAFFDKRAAIIAERSPV